MMWARPRGYWGLLRSPAPAAENITVENHEAKRQLVAETLEQQVGRLLKTTATVAANHVRRRWIIAFVVVLTLVLAGLFALQAQLWISQRDRDQQLETRCESRNDQSAGVRDFAAKMADIESSNMMVDKDTREARVRAYDVLAAAYGDPLDCSIYR